MVSDPAVEAEVEVPHHIEMGAVVVEEGGLLADLHLSMPQEDAVQAPQRLPARIVLLLRQMLSKQWQRLVAM